MITDSMYRFNQKKASQHRRVCRSRHGRVCVFFFQAEGGIRDLTVTGVQTCALPISPGGAASLSRTRLRPPERASWRAPGAGDSRGGAASQRLSGARLSLPRYTMRPRRSSSAWVAPGGTSSKRCVASTHGRRPVRRESPLGPEVGDLVLDANGGAAELPAEEVLARRARRRLRPHDPGDEFQQLRLAGAVGSGQHPALPWPYGPADAFQDGAPAAVQAEAHEAHFEVPRAGAAHRAHWITAACGGWVIFGAAGPARRPRGVRCECGCSRPGTGSPGRAWGCYV